MMEEVQPPKAPSPPTQEEWEQMEPISPRQQAVVAMMTTRLRKYFALMGIGIGEETAREIAIDMWRVGRKFG